MSYDQLAANLLRENAELKRRIAEAVAAEREAWEKGIAHTFDGAESITLHSGDRDPGSIFSVEQVIKAIRTSTAAIRARGEKP